MEKPEPDFGSTQVKSSRLQDITKTDFTIPLIRHLDIGPYILYARSSAFRKTIRHSTDLSSLQIQIRIGYIPPSVQPCLPLTRFKGQSSPSEYGFLPAGGYPGKKRRPGFRLFRLFRRDFPPKNARAPARFPRSV